MSIVHTGVHQIPRQQLEHLRLTHQPHAHARKQRNLRKSAARTYQMADSPDVDRGRPALVRAGVRFGGAEKGEGVCVVEQVERGGPCALRVRFELFGEIRWSAGRV